FRVGVPAGGTSWSRRASTTSCYWSDNNTRYHRTMTSEFGRSVRTRREILGLSQRDLAARSGVKQPLIAAIEKGRRVPSDAVRRSLDRALTLRPSAALVARREAIRDAFAQA